MKSNIDMDFNELRRLLNQGEGLQLDFKRDLSGKVPSDKFAKLMASFANTEGGIILVGVEDDGALLGVVSADKVIKDLATWAGQNCIPPLRPTFGRLAVGNEKDIVWAHVERLVGEPCFVDKRCYIRVGAQCEAVNSARELKQIQERLQTAAPDRSVPRRIPFSAVTAPTTKGFQGRAEQLAQLRSYLVDGNISLIFIKGFSGIGKTTLAARFSSELEEDGYKHVWINCYPDTTYDSLSLQLSAFTRAARDDATADLFDQVGGIRRNRIDQLATALARRRYAFFFDNYHLIEDAAIDDFLQGIEERGGLTKVFLTTRVDPLLASKVRAVGVAHMQLEQGLDLASCSRLLEDCGLHGLSKSQEEAIWELTGRGHPKALQIFAGRARAVPIQQLLSTLPKFRDAIKEQWLQPLLRELPQEQREVVIDLSVFERPLPHKDLLDLYPDRPNDSLERIKSGLLERFVIDFIDGGFLQMHPLIKEYCLLLIPKPEELHAWAAMYYERSMANAEDDDIGSVHAAEAGFTAWWHYVRAGSHEKAAQIADRIRAPLMNSGQYDRAMFLLKETKSIPERDVDWYAINRARIFSLWGQRDEAIESALPLIESANQRIAREACLVVATVYNDHNLPQKAIDLLKDRWSRSFASAPAMVRTRFLKRMVEALLLLGDSAAALMWASEVLKGCPPEDRLGVGVTLRQMAISHRAQGNCETALSLCERSYDLLTEAGTAREAALTQLQLGHIQEEMGLLDSALRSYEFALRQFTSMRDRANTVSCRQSVARIREGLEAAG